MWRITWWLLALSTGITTVIVCVSLPLRAAYIGMFAGYSLVVWSAKRINIEQLDRVLCNKNRSRTSGVIILLQVCMLLSVMLNMTIDPTLYVSFGVVNGYALAYLVWIRFHNHQSRLLLPGEQSDSAHEHSLFVPTYNVIFPISLQIQFGITLTIITLVIVLLNTLL